MFSSSLKTGRVLLPLPAILFALAACNINEALVPPTVAEPGSAVASSDMTSAAFLEIYWARPLPAQGRAPKNFSPLEASLMPTDCGSCHSEQFRDWQTSLHAQAMGPGLMGQLVDMDPAARDDHQACIRCHAPLAEQADALVSELGTAEHPTADASTAALRVTSLHRQGVVCAACHVRAHQRSGPPRRDGSAPDAAQNATLPHAGFVAAEAFENSRFCSACHQFQPDEYALNDKLLENTYQEWTNSRHAREGRTCQSCHILNAHQT